MPGEIIKEFLASVGFAADEKSLKVALTQVAAFGAGISIVAGAIYAGLQRVAKGESELAMVAERLGTSSERIRELGYVAEQAGSSLNAVRATMEAMVAKNPRIRDAAAALEEAGRRMQGMTQAQQRQFASRMGIDLSLIPALTGDVAGLSAEFRKMYAVAGTDSRQAAQASKGFLAELGKLRTLVGMLVRGVATAFLGKIRGDLERFRRIVMDNFGAIKRLFEVVIGVVLRVAGVIGAAAYRIITWVSQIVGWFDGLSEGTRRIILAVLGLYAAWRVLNLGFLATPLGALIAALGVLFLLVDDFLTYMEGGQSLIDWGPWIGYIQSAWDALQPLVAAVRRLGERVLPLLLGAFERVWRFVKDVFIAAGQVIAQAFGGGVGDATGFVDALGDAIEGLATVIGWAFNLVAPMAIEVFKAALGGVIDFARLLMRVFKSVVDVISALFRGDLSGAVQAYLDGLKSVWDFLTSIIGRVAELAKKLGGKILASLGFDVDGLAELAGQVQTAVQPMAAPALVPSPAQAASIDNSRRAVSLDAKTEINVHGVGDPAAVGNQVANRQRQVNADLLRNAQGAAR